MEGLLSLVAGYSIFSGPVFDMYFVYRYSGNKYTSFHFDRWNENEYYY